MSPSTRGNGEPPPKRPRFSSPDLDSPFPRAAVRHPIQGPGELYITEDNARLVWACANTELHPEPVETPLFDIINLRDARYRRSHALKFFARPHKALTFTFPFDDAGLEAVYSFIDRWKIVTGGANRSPAGKRRDPKPTLNTLPAEIHDNICKSLIPDVLGADVLSFGGEDNQMVCKLRAATLRSYEFAWQNVEGLKWQDLLAFGRVNRNLHKNITEAYPLLIEKSQSTICVDLRGALNATIAVTSLEPATFFNPTIPRESRIGPGARIIPSDVLDTFKAVEFVLPLQFENRNRRKVRILLLTLIRFEWSSDGRWDMTEVNHSPIEISDSKPRVARFADHTRFDGLAELYDTIRAQQTAGVWRGVDIPAFNAVLEIVEGQFRDHIESGVYGRGFDKDIWTLEAGLIRMDAVINSVHAAMFPMTGPQWKLIRLSSAVREYHKVSTILRTPPGMLAQPGMV